MKNKLSPNSVDWNRIEQIQKKKDAVDSFEMMNNAVDSIIQPLLNAEEKQREEEKRKEAEEEADIARLKLEEQQRAIEEEKRKKEEETKKEGIKTRMMLNQIIK